MCLAAEEKETLKPLKGNNADWFHSVFFWIPDFVHFTAPIVPLLVLGTIFVLFGIQVVVIELVGASLYLWYGSLYPGNKVKGTPLTKRRNVEIKRKNVAVIGAGPSGVTTAKHLTEAGHSVTMYDSASSIGGEFANRFYPGGRLTTSPYVTAFSDFEPEGSKSGEVFGKYYHNTKGEYGRYLQNYSDHYGITEFARLNTNVRAVYQKRDGDTGDSTDYYLDVEEHGEQEERHGPFDHVAVCAGQNRHPLRPVIKGLESFNGKILHTSDFWKKDIHDIDKAYADLSGKKVLTVGLGESLADILEIVTSQMKVPPKDVVASVRGGVFLIPRINPDNNMNNDFDTTRLRNSIPKYIHNLTLSFRIKLGQIFSKNSFDSLWYKLFLKLDPGPAYVRTTKSMEFMKAVQRGNVKVRSAIDRFHGNTCIFKDESIMENIDVVLYGTGFATKFPFLDGLGDGSNRGKRPAYCPTRRYLRMFDPDCGHGIAFIGMGVRGLIGSIPTVAEIQARLFTMVVSGERVLPSRNIMESHIDEQFAYTLKNIRPGNQTWVGLIDWIQFMDIIAHEIGCLPKRSWFFTEPTLWWKLLVGPMSAFHFRLTGPGSDRGRAANAERIIRKLPNGFGARDVAFFISVQVTYALFAWPWLFFQIVNTSLSDMFTVRPDGVGRSSVLENPALVNGAKDGF